MNESERRLLLAIARWVLNDDENPQSFSRVIRESLSAVEAENAKESGTPPQAGEPSGAFDLEAAVRALPPEAFMGDTYVLGFNNREHVAARLQERYAHHLRTAVDSRVVSGDRACHGDSVQIDALAGDPRRVVAAQGIDPAGGDPLPANWLLAGDPRFYCRAHDCGEFTLGNMPFGYCREHVRQASTGRPKPPDKAGFPPMGTPWSTARADQAKVEFDKAQSDLARLSLVHQQLRMAIKALDVAETRAYGQGIVIEFKGRCGAELQQVLNVARRLAASTTETPPMTTDRDSLFPSRICLGCRTTIQGAVTWLAEDNRDDGGAISGPFAFHESCARWPWPLYEVTDDEAASLFAERATTETPP